ncbi:MAG: hypothetical protein K2M56_08150 [Muribaculaceae bacterium]|nr:hypothetical protein [Muribaculaceae bacterium]
MKLPPIIICLIIYISVTPFMVTMSGATQQPTLTRLDEAIRNRGQYETIKREAIQKARSEYEKASRDEDRYNILRSLYEAYRSYRVDSALIAANKRLEIARRLGNRSKITSASINLAEGYTRLGSADMALNILDTLNTSHLESYHIKYRNAVYREAYRSKLENCVIQKEREQAQIRLNQLTDSALTDSPKTSRSYYTLTAEKLCSAGLYQEAINIIEQANNQFDFSKDAAMLATMGDIYMRAGQRDKAIECLASSAIIDITSGTKEYRSLITLTNLLLEKGDIKRAFEYINCAFEDAEFSHANLRTAEIMKIMPAIDKRFHDTESKIVRRTHIFLVIAGILIGLLLIAIIWYIKALRANRRMIETIEKINKSLAEKNTALMEADALKLHYINILMRAYSEYISRLRDFRKNIYRCMKTNQYEKAYDMVKSKRSEAGDIAAFQGLFDEAFLSMFPDFIEDINSYMKEKIELKDPHHLTPELRVIAMMKLGMGSTEDISTLLHYSNQTIYNLRTSIRGMLNISREEFENLLIHQSLTTS